MILFSQEEIARFRERLKGDPTPLDGLYKNCERVLTHGVKIPKTALAT